MGNDVYTAGMGQPPVEDDMGSIEAMRGKRPMAAPAMPPRRPMGAAPAGAAGMAPPVASNRPMANPADANVYTADKGMPPSPDDMGSIAKMAGKMAPKAPRQMKARGGLRATGMKKGGSVSSASKRADGCAMRGKTKGRMV